MVWRKSWPAESWGPEEVLLAPTVLGLVFRPIDLEKASTVGALTSALNHAQTVLVCTLVLFVPVHASWVTTVLGDVFGEPGTRSEVVTVTLREEPLNNCRIILPGTD